MLLEFTTDLQIDSLNKFFENKTVIWELLPGLPYAERRVNSLDELCELMRAIETVANTPLSFGMQLAPKNDEGDEEMVIVNVYNAKKSFGI